MAEKESGGELIDPDLKKALAHPVVKHMAAKLEETQKSLENVRSMLEQLPEAIGRAVSASMAEAGARQAPDGASGAAFPLRGGEGIEFAPGGRVKLGGREEEGSLEGIQQLLSLVDVFIDAKTIQEWSPKNRQRAVTWARAAYLKANKKKGIRVPVRPDFLK